MRTIWLASTALLITTGIACAQSTQMASPAPTGAVSAAPTTPSGASPGNMAPTPSAASGSTLQAVSGTSSVTSTSPAPNGSASAPDVNSGAAPGTAPGKMAPSSSMAATTGSSPMHMHHWSSTTTLPQNASATTYLHIAKSAIWHHNVSLADDALTHAETDLLNRSVPQGGIAADSSAPVQSIESARQALHAGDYSKASSDTKQAASAVSGM